MKKFKVMGVLVSLSTFGFKVYTLDYYKFLRVRRYLREEGFISANDNL